MARNFHESFSPSPRVEIGSNRSFGDEPALSQAAPAIHGKDGLPGSCEYELQRPGEPIVCTPEDAFHCFMGTDIEILVVGNCLLKKEDQDPALRRDYAKEFELD